MRRHARDLLAEGVGDGRRFMVGVIENVPDRGAETLVPLGEETRNWKPETRT